jgi:hypothetical protein
VQRESAPCILIASENGWRPDRNNHCHVFLPVGLLFCSLLSPLETAARPSENAAAITPLSCQKPKRAQLAMVTIDQKDPRCKHAVLASAHCPRLDALRSVMRTDDSAVCGQQHQSWDHFLGPVGVRFAGIGHDDDSYPGIGDATCEIVSVAIAIHGPGPNRIQVSRRAATSTALRMSHS